MRMWMIPPELMCPRHRTGEHGEIHKHRHNFVSQHSIAGRIFPVVQISPHRMKERHDQLAATLKTHKSPYELPDLSYLPPSQRYAEVDLEYNLKDLASHCPACKKLIEQHKREEEQK